MVVAADKDPLVRRFIESSLKNTEFAPKVVETGGALLDSVPKSGPSVLLSSWDLPDVTGEELSREVRKRSTTRSTYLVATLGSEQIRKVVSAVESGVDDLLMKPFSMESLLTCLRLAAHRCTLVSRSVTTPRDALKEALASSSGGEVVVRSGDVVGRVHVHHGGIVWAHMSNAPVHLSALLENAGVTLDEESIRAVVSEAKHLDAHFTQVLVDWGWVDEKTAREIVRIHLADQLTTLLALGDASAMFLPKPQKYSGKITFAYDEVVNPSYYPPSSTDLVFSVEGSSSLSADEMERVSQVSKHIAASEGNLGVTVLSRSSGTLLYSIGEPIDVQVAWSIIGTLRAMGEGAPEAICSNERTHLVAQSHGEKIVIVSSFDATCVTVGMARKLAQAHSTSS